MHKVQANHRFSGSVLNVVFDREPATGFSGHSNGP
jgi:hypothetical protein